MQPQKLEPMTASNADRQATAAASPEAIDEAPTVGTRDALLVDLGTRLRMLRARRGLTRKATAQAADVSERYLANLEQGIGNPSMLILQQLATALQCTV